ncbi:MAG: 23S rRNA (guanosine(2251)-2'-O)-methyltransferase RlmB [Clostridia bacterium]
MIIEGKNPVYEALRGDATIEKMYVQNGADEGVINNIIRLAREKKIIVSFVDKTTLDRLSPSGRHQGVLATATEFNYSELNELLAVAEARNEPPFLLILDGLTDPHNLGSIIRTAECAGVHGIVIPKHRSVTVNETVIKCSAGAVEHIKIAKVTNINDAIRQLKEQNVYVYGADMDGEPMYSANLKGAIAIVIGSEGEGIKRLTRELCDGIISIEMFGKLNSLNASVAAAILVYERVRQTKIKL